MKFIYFRIIHQGLVGYSILVFLLFHFPTGCSQLSEDHLYSPSAEFEEQETTFVCWNTGFQQTIINLMNIVCKEDHVTLFYNERNHQPENLLSTLKSHHVNTENVTLAPFNLEKDNVWIRDYGPLFIPTEDGNEAVITFKYDHEANQEYNQFGEQYSSRMRLSFLRSNMYSAGGGREINGKGTMILIESYERFINPSLSLKEIEKEYKEKLNQKNIIWLKKGIPQDDAFDNGPVHENIYGNGVNGHIDEFCRFADANTILLARVDPGDLLRDNYYQLVNQRLEESYEILKKARDQDGNPFRIIRVPQAPIIFNEEKYNGQTIYYTPVTSYLNFVLTNNSVVIPAYFEEGDPEYIKQKDEAARRIFQEIFTNRRVEMMHALDLNYSGGGLHCITMNKPKKKVPNKKAAAIILERKSA